MIVNPTLPSFYEPVNQMLISMAADDLQQLREKWDDEASEAAMEGNPYRAGYIEHMLERLG